MNVRELRSLLGTFDPEAVVCIVDRHLGVECHVQVDVNSPFTVEIDSTGCIVTEEDLT